MFDTEFFGSAKHFDTLSHVFGGQAQGEGIIYEGGNDIMEDVAFQVLL